jgi:GntR family transcriptional regulator
MESVQIAMRQLQERPDDRRPLWEKIRDDLLARISAGEFDSAFPGELALTRDYGVSRGTIRSALRPLRDSGYVSAERGNRPHIIAERTTSSYGAIYSLFETVTSAGHSQLSITLTQKMAQNPAVAERLGLPHHAPLFELRRVRLADDEPLAVDHAWIAVPGAQALVPVDFRSTALYKELRERCETTMTGAEETLTAGRAGPDIASALGCDPDEIIVRIERIGFSDGTAIEFRQTCIRADRYTVRTTLGITGHPSPR